MAFDGVYLSLSHTLTVYFIPFLVACALWKSQSGSRLASILWSERLS